MPAPEMPARINTRQISQPPSCTQGAASEYRCPITRRIYSPTDQQDYLHEEQGQHTARVASRCGITTLGECLRREKNILDATDTSEPRRERLRAPDPHQRFFTRLRRHRHVIKVAVPAIWRDFPVCRNGIPNTRRRASFAVRVPGELPATRSHVFVCEDQMAGRMRKGGAGGSVTRRKRRREPRVPKVERHSIGCQLGRARRPRRIHRRLNRMRRRTRRPSVGGRSSVTVLCDRRQRTVRTELAIQLAAEPSLALRSTAVRAISACQARIHRDLTHGCGRLRDFGGASHT